jgi:cardiolipin synthase
METEGSKGRERVPDPPGQAVSHPRPARGADYCFEKRNLLPGNRVTLLKNGAEAFPEMLAAIDAAEDHINLETYIVRSDRTGWRFAESLAAKASSGVRVNVIYDAIGALGCSTRFFHYLQEKGVYLLEYHPIAPWRIRWGWNRRNHRKILVVDGRVGFTGGLNLSDEYADTDDGGGGWRDTHIKIEGPAVQGLQEIFLETWTRQRGHRLSRKQNYYPHPQPAGEALVSVVGNRELRKRRKIRKAYLHALKRANRSILITNAYFVPGRRILRALKKAVKKRGVRVSLILSARSDIPAVRYAGRALYKRLLRWGVRIYEWQERVLHAKTAVVDGIWSTVGTYNIDHRSFLHNLEVNANIMGESFGRKMETMFLDDLKDCREVLRGEWNRRPFVTKVLEWFFYLFRWWL